MDLSPRDSDVGVSGAKRPRRWAPMLVVALALIGGGVVVTKFLTSAIDYYCNVDEVGSRTGCEGSRKFRVQGVVVKGSLARLDGDTTFDMEFNGKTLPVKYQGDPGGVFQECIPVVVHGRIVDGVLEGDRIEVKHSNQYVEKNKKRMDTANTEAAACSLPKE